MTGSGATVETTWAHAFTGRAPPASIAETNTRLIVIKHLRGEERRWIEVV
jgi:hypothetical protein